MIYPTQDPKYGIEITGAGPRLVNASTGVAIPSDEPIFIFRAKDKKAAHHLRSYVVDCNDLAHKQAVEARIDEFTQFAQNHPQRMKEPDTQPPGRPVNTEGFQIETSYEELFAIHQHYWGQFKDWYARVKGEPLVKLNIELSQYNPQVADIVDPNLRQAAVINTLGCIRALSIKISELQAAHMLAKIKVSLSVDPLAFEAIESYRNPPPNVLSKGQ